MPPSTSSGSLTHLDLPSQSPSSSSTAARLLTPTTQQIPLLDSLLARRYNQIHTLLIPAYYYLRSSSLIADPLPTLVQDLVFVTLAQTAHVATSLPAAGNWVSGTNAGRIIEGTASYGSGKTGKSGNVSSTGSLRKKAGVISSASGAISAGSKNSRAVGSSDHNSGGSWRGRAVVSFQTPNLAFIADITLLATASVVSYDLCLTLTIANPLVSNSRLRPPTSSTGCRRARPRGSIIPDHSPSAHTSTFASCLITRLPTPVLLPRRIYNGVARHYGCVATIRRVRRLGRDFRCHGRRLDWSHPYRAGLGS